MGSDDNEKICKETCANMEQAQLLQNGASPPACELFCQDHGCKCLLEWPERCKVNSCAACTECSTGGGGGNNGGTGGTGTTSTTGTCDCASHASATICDDAVDGTPRNANFCKQQT